jgi:1-deoxy-D-xylulose-5-phosphate synthase
MVIAAPADENELQSLLYTAVGHDGPIAIRYPRGCGPGVELDENIKALEIGKGEIVYKNPEPRVLIAAIGSMVYPAVEAAKLLKEKGIAATVLNARFVKPLDEKLIKDAAEKAELVATVEEGTLQGGFGSAVGEILSNKRILRIGLPDAFIEHGKREEILDLYGLTADKIYQSILREIKR